VWKCDDDFVGNNTCITIRWKFEIIEASKQGHQGHTINIADYWRQHYRYVDELVISFPPMFLGVVVVVHAYGLGKLGIGCSNFFMAMVKGLMNVMIRFRVLETTNA
jgi:hypothetical protein